MTEVKLSIGYDEFEEGQRIGEAIEKLSSKFRRRR